MRQTPSFAPWHPYQSFPASPSPLQVSKAQGHHIHLQDGRVLLDGIASWWTSIFGYQHPQLVETIVQQSQRLSHIMFAGLTHEPAEQLTQSLAEKLPHTPAIFLSDSGSIAVEVALKMARQYWQAKGMAQKHRFIALKNGYHGDSWGAMSVTDPEGLHQSFRSASAETYFAPAPLYGFELNEDKDEDLVALTQLVEAQHQHLAGIILEPIWQGAGAMNFYRPAYLQAVRQLCDDYQLLLVVDEIATGFGKTGAYFAHQHADIRPDLVCLGKALTGGMMTLAASCASLEIAETISQHPPYRFMHGPTYMANPLACACANTSLSLLEQINWQTRVMTWQAEMRQVLAPLQALSTVQEVRVLGHIAVVELTKPQIASAVQQYALDQGIWVRPFGHWAYLTPAYTMTRSERHQLLTGFVTAIKEASDPSAIENPQPISCV
jgi:adenosylmethionine-8-amino-7-oxononanoate aminotransferase